MNDDVSIDYVNEERTQAIRVVLLLPSGRAFALKFAMIDRRAEIARSFWQQVRRGLAEETMLIDWREKES